MKAPEFGPIGKEVYERTYRRVKENGENEEWADTVRRVVDGNTALVDEKYIEPNEKDKLFDLIYNFMAIPAGRHLWVSGVPGRQFLFNCHRAAFTEKLSDHYAFTFDELMKGGGVGANYSNRYIDQTPPIENTVKLHIVCENDHPDYAELESAEVLSSEYSSRWDGSHRISDDREGWVEALITLIEAHYGHFDDTDVVLDVSIIRERGAAIRGFGGTASGPAALAIMLRNVNNLLNKFVGRAPTSVEHMLMDHYIAECVIAGNVRRSARMSIKSWRDTDIHKFIRSKADSFDHWTTNISVEIDDDFFNALKKKKNPLHDHAKSVYHAVVSGMLENGEPGFYNVSLASVGELGDVGSTNPCGEIALEPWENCNLGHVNVSRFYDDFEGGKEAFRLMSRFLIRATFGDVPNPLQREVVDRNRRIGVGFFGFQGWLNKQGIIYSESHSNRQVRKTLRDWKAAVDKEAARYAHQLRIPRPIKTTTLAPTGSISQLAGDSASAQTIYAPYFWRLVRFSANDPELQKHIDAGRRVEDDLYSANTKVVYFCVQDPLVEEVTHLGFDEEIIEGANEVGLADSLAVQAMLQECYADNAISFTINVEPDAKQKEFFDAQVSDNVSPLDLKVGEPMESTIEEAKKTIIHYLPHLKGTTIMVDGSRPQAPLQRITKEEFEQSTIVEIGQGELDCGPVGCPIK